MTNDNDLNQAIDASLTAASSGSDAGGAAPVETGTVPPSGDTSAAPPADGAVAPPPTAPPPPALTAPTSWRAETRDAFGKIASHPEFGQYAKPWLDQWQAEQENFRRFQSERDHYAAQAGHFQQAIAPFAQQWQMQGISPQAGLQQGLAWMGKIMEDPQQGIVALAQHLGVDLNATLQDQPYVDPVVLQVQRQNRELQDRLENWERSQQEQAHQGTVNYLTQMIQSFASATDESGAPKSPYFNDVFEDMLFMAPLYQGRTDPGAVQELYERAVWGNPGVRAKLEADRAKAAGEKAKSEAVRLAADAEKAEQANRSVSPSGKGSSGRGRTGGSLSDKDLDKAIAAAQEQLRAR